MKMDRKIRKNSKEFAAALKGARNVRVYGDEHGVKWSHGEEIAA